MKQVIRFKGNCVRRGDAVTADREAVRSVVNIPVRIRKTCDDVLRRMGSSGRVTVPAGAELGDGVMEFMVELQLRPHARGIDEHAFWNEVHRRLGAERPAVDVKRATSEDGASGRVADKRGKLPRDGSPPILKPQDGPGEDPALVNPQPRGPQPLGPTVSRPMPQAPQAPGPGRLGPKPVVPSPRGLHSVPPEAAPESEPELDRPEHRPLDRAPLGLGSDGDGEADVGVPTPRNLPDDQSAPPPIELVGPEREWIEAHCDQSEECLVIKLSDPGSPLVILRLPAEGWDGVASAGPRGMDQNKIGVGMNLSELLADRGVMRTGLSMLYEFEILSDEE